MERKAHDATVLQRSEISWTARLMCAFLKTKTKGEVQKGLQLDTAFLQAVVVWGHMHAPKLHCACTTAHKIKTRANIHMCQLRVVTLPHEEGT